MNRYKNYIHRRVIAAILVLLMVFTMLPSAVSAETESYKEGESQGEDVRIAMKNSSSISLSDITMDMAIEEYYSNTITKNLDADHVDFKFEIQGSGTNHATRDDIITNTLPHVNIYREADALTQENPVASYENGKLKEAIRWEGSEGSSGPNEGNGYAQVQLVVSEGALDPDTAYALVFDERLFVNKSEATLGKKVVFYFTTEKSATGLALNNTKITTSIGQEETLAATFDGTPVTAEWSSDKDSVATVDPDGTVHAISEGTATITAEYQGQTISCTVIVETVAYGMQGTGGNRVSMIQPDDITVLSETDERYLNRINTKFHDDDDVVFIIMMEAGMKQFEVESFVRDNLPLIKVYDTYGGTVVAQSDPQEGQAELKCGGYDTETGIRLTIDQGALEHGSYCLVIGKELAGNAPDKILGKDVVFQFSLTDPQESIEVESVSLDWETVTLARGASLQLKASVTPQDATDPSLSWESSESGVVSVDENGKLTAVSQGNAVITAEAKKGTGSASCEVTVVENELELSDLSLDLSLNQEQTLRARVDGALVDAQWESDAPEVVSVDQNGLVKGLASGHATITATYQGKTAICVVTVTSAGRYGYQGVGGNLLQLKSPDNIYVIGQTNDEYRNGINGTIDGSQEVRFVFTMTAGMNNFKEANFLQNSMPYIKIYNEDRSEVVAEYEDGNGLLRFQGLQESDEENNFSGYVTEGLYIGVDAGVLQNGTYTLVFGSKVCGNNVSKNLGKDISFRFTVLWSTEHVVLELPEMGENLESAVDQRLSEDQRPQEIENLSIVTDGYVLREEDFAFIREELGSTLNSLNLEQAKLPQNQLPQGALENCTGLTELTLPESVTSIGTDALKGCSHLATIRLTGETPPQVEDPSMFATTDLTTLIVPSGAVREYENADFWKDYPITVEVTGVRLQQNRKDCERLTISEGSSETLQAVVEPSNATNQEVTWTSSREEVATVDETGKIQALQVGQTTITVTTKDGGYQDSCRVTVRMPPPVITLNMEQATLYTSGTGTTAQLNAKVTGSELWTSEDVYYVSNNPEIVTVEEDSGLMTAVKEGTTYVTAWVDDQSRICIVTVKDHTIKLDKSSASLYTVGSGSTMTLRVSIDGTQVSGRQATWTSSNSSVTTVSTSGIVTGKSVGTAVITAEANGKKAICTVTVKAATIGLNKTKATLYTKKKNRILLTATVNGTKAAASQVSWTSSNKKVASVSGSGVVTAKRKGTVTITARANGKTATCRVTVKKPTLRLVKKSAKIRRGKKVRIRVKATPKGKVTYKSKNKKVATVSKKGVVRGKKKGKARIQVKCNGVTKTFTVRVR